MIPITRKELYLNKIVGNNDYETPEKPITTEEFFFAEILGEAVQAPEPLTRYQIYLAKIAGRNIEIPYPETRLEYFLAKACGMDIEIPTPITREEIFWSNYSAIVDFEVEGVPPLTYKAIEGTLENYRIYGNTVDGESVGDRTGNLFDGELVDNYHYEPYGYKVPVTVEGKNLFDVELTDACHLDVTTGLPVRYDRRFATSQPITINQGEYCLTYNSTTDLRFMYSVFNDDTLIRRVATMNYRYLQSGDAIDTTGGNKIYFAFYNNDQSRATTEMISNIMLNEGSTPLPYEPYHATVTTPIYLPEPIKMVGDEAEYIDYAEQKMHRVRKNLWSGVVEQGAVSTTGAYASNSKRIRSKNAPLEPGTYTVSTNLLIRAIYAYNDDNKIGVCIDAPLGTYSTSFTVPPGANNISIGMMKKVNGVEVDITPSDFIWGQIEKGSEATIYEPYIENTDLDVILPALPTLPGTNVLSVGTAVQPSKVYVKYKGERQ